IYHRPVWVATETQRPARSDVGGGLRGARAVVPGLLEPPGRWPRGRIRDDTPLAAGTGPPRGWPRGRLSPRFFEAARPRPHRRPEVKAQLQAVRCRRLGPARWAVVPRRGRNREDLVASPWGAARAHTAARGRQRPGGGLRLGATHPRPPRRWLRGRSSPRF